MQRWTSAYSGSSWVHPPGSCVIRRCISPHINLGHVLCLDSWLLILGPLSAPVFAEFVFWGNHSVLLFLRCSFWTHGWGVSGLSVVLERRRKLTLTSSPLLIVIQWLPLGVIYRGADRLKYRSKHAVFCSLYYLPANISVQTHQSPPPKHNKMKSAN